MLLLANLANRKWRKKWPKPGHMGAQLRVLSEGYPMNTNMAGFRWFSKIFASLCYVRKYWKRYLFALCSGTYFQHFCDSGYLLREKRSSMNSPSGITLSLIVIISVFPIYLGLTLIEGTYWRKGTWRISFSGMSVRINPSKAKAHSSKPQGCKGFWKHSNTVMLVFIG